MSKTHDSDDNPHGSERDRMPDRRTFVKGAAIGGTGLLFGHPALAQDAGQAVDPVAPPALGPNAMIDMRFPVSYESSVPAAVRVVTEYFAALSRRDPEAMAEHLHFPFGTFEETDPVVVETREQFLEQPPASMNVITENPRRFTPEDGYVMPGAFDVFMNLEVLGSDPVRAAVALTYDRYNGDGKRICRCEGVYSVTNNDGKWAIQLMSTIFKPDRMIGVTYDDTVDAVKRIRIHHNVLFMHSDWYWESLVPQLGTRMSCGITGPAPHYAGPEGRIMDSYQVEGITSRLRVQETTQEDIDELVERAYDVPAEDPYFQEYRELFPRSGVGEWGWVCGTNPETRVVHHDYHKAHILSGAFRFTAQGEVASHSNGLEVITYRKGRWGRASGGSAGLLYATIVDRSNDVRPGSGGPAPEGIG